MKRAGCLMMLCKEMSEARSNIATLLQPRPRPLQMPKGPGKGKGNNFPRSPWGDGKGSYKGQWDSGKGPARALPYKGGWSNAKGAAGGGKPSKGGKGNKGGMGSGKGNKGGGKGTPLWNAAWATQTNTNPPQPICFRFHTTGCNLAACNFSHTCPVKKPDGTPCGGYHKATNCTIGSNARGWY